MFPSERRLRFTLTFGSKGVDDCQTQGTIQRLTLKHRQTSISTVDRLFGHLLFLSVLYACVFYFCICTCSAQLSMFHMEKRSRHTLIIIIIIIIIIYRTFRMQCCSQTDRLESGSSGVRIPLAPGFFESSHTSDLKLALQWLPCQAPGVTGSVSVYCALVK